MEFKRDSVITLYLAGKPQVAIVIALLLLAALHRVHKVDEKKTVTTPEMIGKVKARFDRNPRRNEKKNCS